MFYELNYLLYFCHVDKDNEFFYSNTQCKSIMSVLFEVGGTVISADSSFHPDVLMMTDMYNRHDGTAAANIQ